MRYLLNRIRCVDKKTSISSQIAVTFAMLMFGIVLGIGSKFLDCTASNELPFIVGYLDITNFLGRFAIWILIALCISVYSISPIRAGINVFMFFVGMVTSYYLYSTFVAGFFPRSYAMIWIGFTVISPLLACISWYAKGNSRVSFFLSVMIIAVLFNMTFVYGWGYFEPISLLELVVFVCGLLVMKRRTIKETTIMIILGIVLAFILDVFVPFHFY